MSLSCMKTLYEEDKGLVRNAGMFLPVTRELIQGEKASLSTPNDRTSSQIELSNECVLMQTLA
jgi:hypothetical protein